MRKVVVALFAVALILFGAAFPALFPGPSKVIKAAFGKIEEGMSQAEVEALLGGPPGDYTTGPTFVLSSSYSMGEPGTILIWHDDDGLLAVGVDESRVVRWKEFSEGARWNLGPVEQLQWRFERWRERVFGTTH
jgi:hypothetical protein